MTSRILLFVVLASFVTQNSDAQVQVSVPNITGSLNQTIVVPVNISGVESGAALTNYQIFPVPSSTNIVFLGGDFANTLSAGFGSNACLVKDTGGPIDRCSGFNGNITTSGILLYLKFKIIGPITNDTVSLNNFLFNGPSDPSINPLTPVIPVSISSAPVAVADSYALTEGGTLTVNEANGLLNNDTSVTNGVVVITDQPVNGTLTANANGSFTYVHNGSQTATDTFKYTVTTNLGTSAKATVTLNVTLTNDPPNAANKSVIINEDTPTPIVLSGSDEEGSPLTFSIVTAPLHGTATLSGSTVTYTPVANYNGPDSFTYKANDGLLDSTPATVSITVAPVNDAPIAIAKTGTTLEDTALPITLSGTDIDGDALTFVLVSAPSFGSVVIVGTTATYTPSANYFGTDSFTYKANDGTVDSAPATVSLTITAVNDAPVVSNVAATTLENVAKAITLVGTDVEQDALTFTVATAPTNGSVAIVGSTATYTPNPNYFGTDTFTYVAFDGAATSAAATVTVTITSVNETPTATAKTGTTLEDTPVPITLSGIDPDGDALTFAVVSAPSFGSVVIVGTTATYTPNANYFGTDSFTYKANDGTVDSAPATVSLTITAVNDAPVVSNVAATTLENVAKAITLIGTDIEQDALTFTVATAPTNGTVAIVGSTATYTPNPNYFGTDTFTYVAFDGADTSAAATVTVSITFVNESPTATPITETTLEDTAVQITLSGIDADGDALTFAVVSAPSNGSVAIVGATATYTPNANFNGTDSFAYKANDGTVDSVPAIVSLTITAVNDLPTASDIFKSTTEDVPAVVVLLGNDIDGDILTYEIVQMPLKGTVSLNGALATYTPNLNYSGTDSFTYVAKDGTGQSNAATVSITISSVNDAPTASNIAVSTNEDVMVEFALLGMDPENSALTYVLESPPSNGSVVFSGSLVRYTPSLDFNGTDSFTYKVNDGTSDSTPGTVTITVIPVNDRPKVVSQSVSTSNDQAIDIVVVGTDVDQDQLTYSITTNPTFGSTTLTSNTVHYVANPGFVGVDSFGIIASDGMLDSDVGIIVVSVSAAKIFSVQFINGGGQGLPETIDVYYKGQKVVTGLALRSGSVFYDLPLGGTSFSVATSPSASESESFKSFPVSLLENDKKVAVFVGSGSVPSQSLMVLTTGSKNASNSSRVEAKLVHASVFSPGLDVTVISDQTGHADIFSFASGVLYSSVGAPFLFSPGVILFKVSTSGANPVVYDVFKLDLSADTGSYMSIVASGNPNSTGSGAFSLFGVNSKGERRLPVVVTGKDQSSTLPSEFVLLGNYPNPFNPSTTIQFDLPAAADVKIDVLDLLGRTMISIPSQTFDAGSKKSVSVDASALTSGIYMYRVIARTVTNTFVSTGTMTLIK